MTSNRLGLQLLQQKLVTPGQLDEALKNQAIFGGRLGSHLVDAGFLDEPKLARFLGQVHRVAFAHSGHFANLPDELLGCVPKELVEKYLVIPLKRENKRLYLAMANPADLAAIEEIGFRTGFLIRPVITPETVLVKYLKRYYAIDRTSSYILRDLPRESPSADDASSSGEDPSTWLGGTEQDTILTEWERKFFASRNPAEPDRAAANHQKTPAPPQRLGEKLAANLDRELLADLLAEHLAREYGSGALLLVRGETLVGWRGISNQAVVPGFKNFQLDLKQPSALQTVAATKTVYAGPLSTLPGNTLIASALGHPPAEQVLIVPVLLLGRVIAMLYLDHPNLNLAAVRNDVQKLAAMLALGLEILILKNKLAAM